MMNKLVLLSDPHLDLEVPKARLDADYIGTQTNKFRFVLSETVKRKALLCIAGDLCNRPRSWFFLPYITQLLVEQMPITVGCVFGQHDTYMYSESTRINTTLGELSAAGLVHIFGEKAWMGGGYCIYGCHYGQEPPMPKSKDSHNVLVIHAPIAKKALWHDHEYMDAEKYLDEHKEYKLILCGDIHQQFHIEKKGRHIVNTGPLMRRSATTYNFKHKPSIAIYDGEDIEWIIVPHESGERVLSREHIESEQNKIEILDDFIFDMKSVKVDEGVSLVDNIWKFVKENKVEQGVVDVLAETIGGKQHE